MPLKPPPPNLSSIPLTTKTIAASNLYRVSRYTSGEPFFGRTALNRFDDRSRPKKGRFGTCYCGLDLETAVTETVLHDLMPVNGRFSVPFSEFESRQLVRFTGSSLVLANLTGASLKTLVGDGALSTITPYDLPQQWAMAIHRHPQRVDGLLYMSTAWKIPSLATTAPEDFARDAMLCAPSAPDAADEPAPRDHPGAQAQRCIETFEIAFIDPVNPYSLSDRAMKYGLLFIGLTFLAVGSVEVLRQLRVHPVQYLLVGCAVSIFFLLLLSLSEHLRFDLAYAIAASACVALLSFYARHLLRGWRPGLLFGAGIAGLYAALYVLLQLEQTALVVGSVLLFAVLASAMVLTRHVDWYRLFGDRAPVAGSPR